MRALQRSLNIKHYHPMREGETYERNDVGDKSHPVLGFQQNHGLWRG